MKNFFRTFVGKGILYVAVLLSAVILTLSVSCAGYMIFSDYYKYSEQEIEERELERFAINHLENMFYNYFDNQLGQMDSTNVRDDGNFVFRTLDADGNVVMTSSTVPQEYTYRRYISVHIEKAQGEGLQDYYVVSSHADDAQLYEELAKNDETQKLFIMEGSINTDYRYIDDFKLFHVAHHTLYTLKVGIYFIAFLALALMIVSFVALMCVAGRRPKKEEIVPWYFHKLPYEVIVGVPFSIFVFFAVTSGGEEEAILGSLGFLSLFFPLFCMSTAVRIKTHTIITNTLIYKICMFLWKGFVTLITKMKLLYKTILVLLGLMFVWFVVICIDDIAADVFMFFLAGLVVIPAILWIVLQINRVKNGARELAAGNFDYVINTKGMLPEIKKHAEDLNNIAKSQKIALEDKLKSERMKTELITNVSHDIKTPLTSIINYADLISKEESTSETGKEYSEVLVRQSKRLKTLLEDLIEASKASTGNLEVDLQPCDAQVFVTQTAGEFEEKFQNSELSLITSVPDEQIRIMADGRRMQRIFDNLMNNICKYSLPGTRVYVDLTQTDKDAVFVFKNTSKEPLNMSEEELMERFTRGDSSRNTEGSGLGLSIASNLAELQNGQLRLSTDGDLFKATLTFPKI